MDVPTGLIRILNRGLEVAGIEKRDELGRTVDVHTLRHSFGTHLSRGAVAPRTAQAAMRHSSIDLTMNAYTASQLLDVQGALHALSALPLWIQPGWKTYLNQMLAGPNAAAKVCSKLVQTEAA